MTRPSSIDTLRSRLTDNKLNIAYLPDGSAVLLDLGGNQVLALSETAAFIVSLIRGGVVSEESGLVRQLTEHFDVEMEAAAADVREFVARLGEVVANG